MGKTTSSCFKFITCAGDSVDHDNIGVPESKDSNGRGWSFRKRSTRHRVLSNNVISESSSSAIQENPELTAANYQLQPNVTVFENTSLTQCTKEMFELSAQPLPEVSDNMAPAEDGSQEDATVDDSSIIIIQAEIRRSLARRLLLKHKSVIKLQALVRGHIARKQAVETLRGVQAIVRNRETAVQMGGSECGTGIEESAPTKESNILGSTPSSLLAIDSLQLQHRPDANPSGMPLKLETEGTDLMEKSSLAASPTSCRTIPVSQATPASQVSVEPKKGRGDKGEANQKSMSSRITWEQRKRQNAKIRYSFGSAKSYDHANQEPRDSSSSNFLPSYMQATESARAKAIIKNSPRSSPGLHDKDIYIEKRLSLPGTDRRQGSPRLQRSLSQAQQKAKGYETHSLLERKWRR